MPREADPDKMDRGTAAHNKTQNALAEALQKAILEPWSQGPGDPAFDIAWRDDDGVPFIGEVKSLAKKTRPGRFRLAIDQVLDYVHKLDSQREADSLPPGWEGVHAVRGVVAVERQPKEVGHWMGVCEKHGIILTWPEIYDDTLVDLHLPGLFAQISATYTLGSCYPARP